MRKLLPILLLAGSLVGAPSALAASKGCDAPAGIAATDEYCDVLPSAAGGAGGAQRPLGKELPARTRKALRDAGPLGAALLGLPAPATLLRQGRQDGAPGLADVGKLLQAVKLSTSLALSPRPELAAFGSAVVRAARSQGGLALAMLGVPTLLIGAGLGRRRLMAPRIRFE